MRMLKISNHFSIPLDDIEMRAIRAQGAGGQNVNKVSTAIHLRFDISASSLPVPVKNRLLELKDQRITKEGIVIIKSQRFRSQEKNREEALLRLKDLILSVEVVRKKRKPTRSTYSSRQKRISRKVKRGRLKALRSKFSINGSDS